MTKHPWNPELRGDRVGRPADETIETVFVSHFPGRRPQRVVPKARRAQTKRGRPALPPGACKWLIEAEGTGKVF